MHRGQHLIPFLRRLYVSKPASASCSRANANPSASAGIQSRQFYGGRRGPFYEIEQLMRDTEQRFKHQFDNFFKEFSPSSQLFKDSNPHTVIPFYRRSFGSHADISTATKFKLEFNFEGATPEDITVNLKDRTLTIKAKVTEKSEFSHKHHEMDYEYTLPESVDVEGLQSTLSREGILNVEAPINVPSKSTTININRE